MLKLPVNKDNAVFPVGDFRNWSDIETWAGSIAEELKVSPHDAKPAGVNHATALTSH